MADANQTGDPFAGATPPPEASSAPLSASLAFALAMEAFGSPLLSPAPAPQHPPKPAAPPPPPAPAANPTAGRPPLAPHNNRQGPQAKPPLPPIQRPARRGAAVASRQKLAASIQENLVSMWQEALKQQDLALVDAAVAGAKLKGLAPAVAEMARGPDSAALAAHFMKHGTEFVKRATECAELAAQFNSSGGN